MLPSVCDIPKEIVATLKKIIAGALSLFFKGLAAIAALFAVIQQVINTLRQLIAYVKSWIEQGARLFLRLLDIVNSRSVQEACAKYNALVEDFGDWSGFQNVVDTLQLDCTKIPSFSIKDLCELLDDVVYEEVDGVKTYRVLPKRSGAPTKIPEVSVPSALPSISVPVDRKSITPWFQQTAVA